MRWSPLADRHRCRDRRPFRRHGDRSYRAASPAHAAVSAVVMLALTVTLLAGPGASDGYPLPAVVLAFAPGGLAEMSLIALALSVDAAFVASHHIARIMMVVTAPLSSGCSVRRTERWRTRWRRRSSSPRRAGSPKRSALRTRAGDAPDLCSGARPCRRYCVAPRAAR